MGSLTGVQSSRSTQDASSQFTTSNQYCYIHRTAIMGNAQARRRIKASDFHYLAKFTAFASNDLVEDYYNKLIERFPDGKMDIENFIATFQTAFPERPKDKVEKLAEEMANKEGKISMANMLILFYLFSSGKTEDNLVHIFNLFDQDGNKVKLIRSAKTTRLLASSMYTIINDYYVPDVTHKVLNLCMFR